MSLCVFGVERSLHVQAVQPDLPWVDLLVPVDPAACARLVDQLAPEPVGGQGEPLLPAPVVQREQGATCIDLVEVVFAFPVCGDRSIGSDESVVHRVDPRVDGIVLVPFGTPERCIEHQSVLIVPQHHARSVIALHALGDRQGQGHPACLSHLHPSLSETMADTSAGHRIRSVMSSGLSGQVRSPGHMRHPVHSSRLRRWR